MMSTSLVIEKGIVFAKPGDPVTEFKYFSEQFADLRILRYHVSGFEKLSVQKKKLAYYLSQAALAGRDIYWDQNYRHNLTIRRALEEIIKHYEGDRATSDFQDFLTYTKRVWFSNGIHHHYSSDKIIPAISPEYFRHLFDATAGNWPMQGGESREGLRERLIPLIFDPSIDPKKVSKKEGQDLVLNSAVNFYENVTQDEVDSFYQNLRNPNDLEPISYGLNSKVIKNSFGEIEEKTYRVGGMYSAALTEVVKWLRQALTVCESPLQRQALEVLISYYETGDLRKFDEYNKLWVQDTTGDLDTINGFIEVYDDPLGRKASWEAVVQLKDPDATEKFGVLSSEAAWFEEHSPIDPLFKRPDPSGVSYKVILAVMEGGASSPSTPIGINLPNSDWIRSNYGSKSISLGNIEHAYSQASKESGALAAFYLPIYHEQIKKYGDLAGRLTTGLHEVIGHASGRLADGVAPPHETLKNYASTLEEARADLVALYYIGDQHLVDLGLSDSTEIMKAEYITYITGGLMTQLARIDLGKNIEEDHMRNRQMISAWVYEKGKADNVIERTLVDGKTFFVINDFNKLRVYFGVLLAEVQRIKSTGDFEAGKNLVETFGVVPDRDLHAEVKVRWESLRLAPYSGFINPHLEPAYSEDGSFVDVRISYPESFTRQMLGYSQNYSFLPHYN